MLALAAGILLAGSAHAQSVWTFAQVLQAAIAGHPSIMVRQSTQAAAQAEREGAEWQRYPTPSFEASTFDGGNGFLRLEQPLWAGGRITGGIDAASRRFDAAGAAVAEARLDVSLRVIAAYTEALRQKARQQDAATGVREQEKLLTMIRRRVQQEVSSLTDQRLAESRLYLANNDWSLASQELNNALARLAQLTGQPVAEVSAQGLSEAGAPAGLEAALTQALAYSPLLQRLAHEEEAANADITVKRSAYLPQLALRLERVVNQQSVGLTEVNDNRAMLVLQAQPGAGLSAASGVDAAIARRDAARMAITGAEREVRERVTLDWNEWISAQARVGNADQSRLLSAEVFESYTRQYVTGRKTWIDVMNGVREAMQSALAADDARAQMLGASLRLRALGGTLQPGEGSQL